LERGLPMRTLTEKDYKVMTRIMNPKDKTGLSKLNGVTRKYLTEATKLSYSKVRLAIESLKEHGFIEEGIAKGRESTYYLTEKGMLELKSLAQSSIIIKGEKCNE
jgi:predicted transcriptional regulator